MISMGRGSTSIALVQELSLIPGLEVKVGEPLARYTSIKIGGPADYLLDVESSPGLAPTLRVLKRHGIPFYLLGKGSNMLVSDLGVRGAVLRLGGGFKGIVWGGEHGQAWVAVGAAYPVTRLVREVVRRGYVGLEFAEGIPGSVGGALVMNAGAYGREMEKVVDRVEGVTPRGQPVEFNREELAFSYRDARLPSGTVVTRVRIRLTKGEVREGGLKVRELVDRRKKAQPSGYPNCGSMFRNPPGDFAGRLIEVAGLKGRRVGRAEVSERHANFIINRGGAKAVEVRRLMEIVGAEVKKRFGVRLEPEVRFLGEWPGWTVEG
ncbi:MAG: UDP-N-acetylmuramate dehydrogenase [Candidatus Binatia bacterium]